MTGIDSWSTTAATNATADAGSVNWAEGQAPSTVNNTARQMCADVRSAFNDLIWFQYGTGDQGSGNIAVPSVYASATSFTITGADVTAAYHANRRVRAVGSSTGTIYGSISSSSYNGGNTTTTVNVTWDSGSLSNETLVVSLAQAPVTGLPMHVLGVKNAARTDAGQTFTGTQAFGAITATTVNGRAVGAPTTWTPADGSGAGLSFTVTNNTVAQSGALVTIHARVVWPVTANGATAKVSGVPVVPGFVCYGAIIAVNGGGAVLAQVNTDSTITFFTSPGGGVVTNATLSAAIVFIALTYISA